ncbi:hypothetical protein EDD16DRAFT_1719009 [Pisolithus croceorrhizus]|nr:hypothetical protein EV401DRAFT_2083591 [Pisolithus croceorrhizus]KAI6097718.1 hypothetical protein EDD16DRAFT_1719009 [Pisolithus croceorrhizus]KAI6167224.1 hypothetical protein EDD17DRAFT_1845718 [Pisolithus thermaeus]
MEGQQTSTVKRASGSPKKPRKRMRVPAGKEQLSLQAIHQIKEVGKQTHLRATKTRETYSRHIRQARSWLQSHFPAEGTPRIPAHAEDESDIYADPGFKDAFGQVPNQCSDKALALYLSWRGFQEDCSQSTIDGIRAAFKMLWDEADGAIFRGEWHHNDARHRWEGNPVLSAEVSDIVASIRHKVSSQGAERTHSGAMKKEYMDRILTWSESQCSLHISFQYIRHAMTGRQVLPPGEFLGKDEKLRITQHLQHLACGATAFTLWTRNYELVKLKRRDVNLDRTVVDSVFMKYLKGEEQLLTINDLNVYFEIHLKNRKGWQRKLDKGMKEADLQSNHYRIYPRPDMGGACDAFLRLVFWMKWVEFVHLGRPMADEDFLFPALGANGVLQPGQPLSHDTVQKWIDEAVAGAGIHGTFSTHCYRRGGAQYWFMFAPVGQRWTLARVRWWGGWAEGEHVSGTASYLGVDALRPVSREANGSFAGEAALTRPASTEALHMAHMSLTADVAALTADVAALHTTMKENMKVIHQQIGTLVARTMTPTAPTRSASHPNPVPSLACQRTSAAPSTIQSACMPVGLQPTQLSAPQLVQPSGAPPGFASSPSHVGPQRTTSTSTHAHTHAYTRTRIRTSNLPPGLLIPNVPVLHADGTRTPKSDSWRDIVRHWTEGEPRLGLHIPLRDWPHHYYNGPYGRQFNTKHYQRSVVATEFLDEFQGDEDAFLKAYGGAAREGHTKLLKAILGARKQHRGNGERRSCLANEPQRT